MPLRSVPALSVPSVLSAIAVVAGCLGGGLGVGTHYEGTSPFVATDWAWDGAGVTASEGRIVVDAFPENDTGLLNATFTHEGALWEVAFDAFAELPDRPYQAGGVVSDIRAHGDTGNGDANLPAVRYLLAGWGEAHLTRDGTHFGDPVTGGPTVRAHFMVVDAAVRDPETQEIRAADGSPYSPERANGSAADSGPPQIILLLQSHAPSPPGAPLNESFGDTVTNPQYTRSFAFELAAEGSGRLAAAIQSVGPLTTADLTFSLKDPAGNELGSLRLGAQTTPSGEIAFEELPPGTYAVDVSGAGVNAAYTVTVEAAGAAAPPGPPFFLIVTYEDVDG
ncbi:MAG: hypothetical protein ACT4PT_06865 [Methanobacteriota archaeon]